VCHYHVMSALDVEHIISAPWVAIGSDAGVVLLESGSMGHPRSYGTFPRILDYYVKEKQLLSLEDAVRKMTSLPAQILGIKDRGRLLEGYKADLVVFDLPGLRDNSTFEHPDRSPDGIEWVIVNGVLVMSHNKHTGEKPGEPVYGAGRR
jgi:N-acyl-D-amino-acid deacylase